MEDIEHVRIYLLEQYADYSKDIPEISVEEQTGNQDEKDSTHKGRNLLIKDRDPKGINCFLKVIYPVVIAPPPLTYQNRQNKISWLFLYKLVHLCKGH